MLVCVENYNFCKNERFFEKHFMNFNKISNILILRIHIQ